MDKSGMVTNAAFAELFKDFVVGYGFADHLLSNRVPHAVALFL